MEGCSSPIADCSDLHDFKLDRQSQMGSGASKAQRATRKYPSPSNIPHYPASIPPQTRNPSLPPSPFPRPADVSATAAGAASTKTRPPGSLDPRLAARLQELGPVTVPRYEPRIPTKVCSITCRA